MERLPIQGWGTGQSGDGSNVSAVPCAIFSKKCFDEKQALANEVTASKIIKIWVFVGDNCQSWGVNAILLFTSLDILLLFLNVSISGGIGTILFIN